MTTHASLMTPSVPAGLAVVRLVGSNSEVILKRIFRLPSKGIVSLPAPASALMGSIIDPNAKDDREILDQVILAREDDSAIYDINCHGGPRIIQRLLLLLQTFGIEIVPWPDLFPVTTLTREVEQILPRALTRLGVQAIAAQSPGGLAAWAKKTVHHLQTDPDILSAVQSTIESLLSTYPLAQKLLTPATIVVTGPVNSGKSTLVNVLSGRLQSITSDRPGTTRDWTAQITDIQGIPINLIDTAGRSSRADLFEQRSLQLAKNPIDNADLILLLLDASGNIECQKNQLQASLPTGVNSLTVINKCDLHPDLAVSSSLQAVSALMGLNLDQLRQAIAEHLGFTDFNALAPLVFTARQVDHFQACLTASSAGEVVSRLNRLRSSNTDE